MSQTKVKDSDETIRLLVIGAHPDDPDFSCGGTAIRFLDAGHDVMFVSLTDGSSGHHLQSGQELVQRRMGEAQKVADLLGLTYLVMGNQDGRLQPTLSIRESLIALIREYQPTLIVTHRPNDYHPDHRSTSLLVQDTAFLVCVPNVCPEVPCLSYNPVILYTEDPFQKPEPFRPEIIVDITGVYQRKLEALQCHESQMFEWLPFVQGLKQTPPAGQCERLKWLDEIWGHRFDARRHTDILRSRLAADEVCRIRYVESFEVCEFGGHLTAPNLDKLFPFAISALDE